MKKSLIAAAVLAASGAAMAQNVSVYGIVDVFLGSVDNGTVTQTVLDAGGVSPNRWGLKGSEDLGGGLKAEFNLEQGFNADNGAGGSTGFARQSWVGFSGKFGAVRLGRTTTPFDDVSGSADAVFDSALSPMNQGVFISGGYTARPNNTIYYQAPDFSGFSGAFSYSLGEDKTATANSSSTTSMNLTYAAGALGMHFGYQKEDTFNNPVDPAFTRLGATYDLGPAVLYANYGNAKDVGVSGADTTEYQIGADYKVSGATTVSASYANSQDNATAGDAKRNGFGVGVNYVMSKRTSIYGGYVTTTTTPRVGADTKVNIYAVGVRHAF